MPDPLHTAKPCPICRRPATEPRFRPFCSARCADVDLGRWFGGAYAIPGPPPELDEDPPANRED
ncbi:MAG TPA: DNA gyrase inhibitor YacG [Acetobacteraceae bacterium]